MSDTQRDPRVDPKRGDVLERNSKTGRFLSSRRVRRVESGEITYMELNSDTDHDLIVIVRDLSWRKWAKDAEVISRGE